MSEKYCQKCNGYLGGLRAGSTSEPCRCEALFAIDPERDWPWGDGDNDNYLNNCFGCRFNYRGHKYSQSCRKCQNEHDARRAAMTEEERQEEDRKMMEAVEIHFKSKANREITHPRNED